MKDKVYSVIAFIAFIVILLIVVVNYNPDTAKKIFGVGTYYIPIVSSKQADEREAYASMMGGSVVETCPVTELSLTQEGIIYLPQNDTTYPHECFFFTNFAMNKVKGNFKIPANTPWLNSGNESNSIAYICGSNILGSTGDNEICFNDFPYPNDPEWGMTEVEIIAPFDFRFDNNNISEDGMIIIYDTAGTTRVTFQDVPNWFCAGYNYSDDWYNHKYDHKSIIGSSANAKVKSGVAGSVIGYADRSTKVIIESNNSGYWKTISIKEWITGEP